MIWSKKINYGMGENICNVIADKRYPECTKNYKSLWQTLHKSGEGIWIAFQRKGKLNGQ